MDNIQLANSSTRALDFELECQTLGLACAKAKQRLVNDAPQPFKTAYLSYRGLRAKPSYFEAKCLSLRLSAIKRGMILDPQVDAAFLEQVTPRCCPVTLETFDINGKSPANPSVDRLINEGTYAAGNIGIFSVRANQAKGSKTFEEVAAIASQGMSQERLEAVEWMRLASIMYGAWSVAVRKADPFILPLATYPGRGSFTSNSQFVQLMLLLHCRDEVWPNSMNEWMQATAKAGGSQEQFLAFAHNLRSAMQEEEYPPSAWLHGDVFDEFVDWYNKCRPAIDSTLEPFRRKYQAGVDTAAIVALWKVGSRYQR